LNCDRVKGLVLDLLDGALDRSGEEAVRGHLELCPPCRVFHDEMTQSLALLRELPAVEVSSSFDDAVWRRVRALEAPAGVRKLVRRRIADAWSRFRTFPSYARWTPAFVTAGVLMLLAIAPRPQAGPEMIAAAPPREPAATVVAAVPEVVEGAEARAASVVEVATPEEVYAGIPEAVEAFLETARDLRLETDSDQYRRSNYTYPLRHVHTHVGQSVGQTIPVSVRPAQPEVTVVSF
jgi:anti-sigma factor RsiW